MASTIVLSALAGKIHAMENLESAEKLKLYFVPYCGAVVF
jgi:hypothetical protein